MNWPLTVAVLRNTYSSSANDRPVVLGVVPLVMSTRRLVGVRLMLVVGLQDTHDNDMIIGWSSYYALTSHSRLLVSMETSKFENASLRVSSLAGSLGACRQVVVCEW